MLQHISGNLLALLRTEIPSGMCAKFCTVAASNNRDHARNLSSRTLVVTFNRLHRQSYNVAMSLTIACSRYIHNGVILHAHPVRGESHNQSYTTGEVATAL